MFICRLLYFLFSGPVFLNAVVKGMFYRDERKRDLSLFTAELQFTLQRKKKHLSTLCVCSRLVNLARSKKLREQKGKIVLEGRRVISEALDAGASPLTVFFSTVERLQELPVNKLAQASLVKVKLEDVRVWPDLDAVFDMMGKTSLQTNIEEFWFDMNKNNMNNINNYVKIFC